MKNHENIATPRIQPQAIELEEAVLGAIILESDKLQEVLRIIRSPECFYKAEHQKVYAAIEELVRKGSAVDLLTVTAEMRRSGILDQVGGAYFVTQLTSNVTSSAHVEDHARIVVEKWIGRQLIRISAATMAKAYEDSDDIFEQVEKAENAIGAITGQIHSGGIKSIGASLVPALQEMREAQHKPDGMTGLPTPIRKLNDITKGLQRGNMITIAGGTGEGKTTLALNICEHIAETTGPTGFISLEMRDRELIWKLISRRIQEDVKSVMSGNFSESKWRELETSVTNRLHKLPLYIHDAGGLNIVEVKAIARTMVQKHDIKALGVDYIQLIRGVPGKKYGTREQEVAEVSKELKALAMELDIPLIALSQLNRMEKGNKRMYVLSDLRESGSIEQDSNMVWFIYRPVVHKLEEFEGVLVSELDAWINIAKSRLGSTGLVRVRFDGAFNGFSDYDPFGLGQFDDAPLPTHSAGIAAAGRQIVDFSLPKSEQDFPDPNKWDDTPF